MRILVLGGAGGMGRVAAREAATFSFVDQVTVADIDAARAGQVAEELGPKAKSLRLDVTDAAAMRDALAHHDLVLNASGPFYEIGTKVLAQVIDAGVHYADICDAWEPTLEMLELGERAKARAVVAIIGIGASPGATNLLAMMAASRLDRVDEILTGWSIAGDRDETERAARKGRKGPAAAMVHLVQQLTGQIRQLEMGALRDVKPLQAREIRFAGHGSLTARTIGHPEAVTLPRLFEGLSSCANVMIGPESTFEELDQLAAAVDKGLLTIEAAAALMEADSGDKKSRDKGASVPLPGIFGWASGTRDGRPVAVSAHLRSLPAGGMAGVTSVPLSLVIPFFRDGFGDRAGVFTPEEILDPQAFMDLLAPHCRGEFADGKALVALGEVMLDTGEECALGPVQELAR